MTAKEKVLKRYPEARARKWGGWRDGESGWVIEVGGISWRVIGAGETEEAAWQNAAESLPAPQEQERCPECRGTKEQCLGNEYCWSRHWPKVDPIPAVEGKEKEPVEIRWCSLCHARRGCNVLPQGVFCGVCGTECIGDLAEPKPTPATEEEPDKFKREAFIGSQNLIDNQHEPVKWRDIAIGVKADLMRYIHRRAEEIMKPQDSSSISTEQELGVCRASSVLHTRGSACVSWESTRPENKPQTFDAWMNRHIKARDQFGFTYNDLRDCWNAAKASEPKKEKEGV